MTVIKTIFKSFKYESIYLFIHTAGLLLLVQWQVTGGLGCPGASAVRPVVKECSPGYGCATILLLRSMGRSARAQTPKHKCARRNRVPVGIQWNSP